MEAAGPKSLFQNVVFDICAPERRVQIHFCDYRFIHLAPTSNCHHKKVELSLGIMIELETPLEY